MCESKLILVEGGEEKVIADNVAYLDLEKMTAVRIDGSRIDLSGYRIASIDFINHKVFVRRA